MGYLLGFGILLFTLGVSAIGRDVPDLGPFSGTYLKSLIFSTGAMIIGLYIESRFQKLLDSRRVHQ